MRDERQGIVPLVLSDGRTIPLRFTWGAIDKLGAGGMGELLERAGSGLPGDMSALAALLETASDGALVSKDLLEGRGTAFSPAYVAILSAWTLAVRGPGAEDGKTDENPLKRLQTWLAGLWRRLTQSN